MTRTRIVLVIGLATALVGAFLEFRADSLGTHWQPLGDGAWGGTTDPAAVRSYQAVGLALLLFGFTLALAAVCRWMVTERRLTGRT